MKQMFSFVAALLAAAASFASPVANLDSFFHAIGTVESNNRASIYNPRENAIGIYQIRKLYWIDSRIEGKHEDCFNVDYSRKVVIAYFRRYEPTALKENNWEVLAKLHNGGPNWRKKTGAAKENLRIYWEKIRNTKKQ